MQKYEKESAGQKVDFFLWLDGHVVCGCVRQKFNPDAPDIILPGDTDSITEQSEIFCRQQFHIPIFVFVVSGSRWKYVGDYRVEDWTENKREISLHQKRAARKVNRTIPISRILFLEKAPVLEI